MSGGGSASAVEELDQLGVKGWAGRNGFSLNGREATHTLLDGGMLHVPMSAQELFHELLAGDLDKGINNFVVEYRTPLFRMFADLDILEENPLTNKQLYEWLTEIQSVMVDLFGKAFPNNPKNDKLIVVVCKSPDKPREKNKQTFTKTGIHLIWPNVIVNSEKALFVRSAWIQRFETKFGLRHASNIWEDVFDRSVYEKNGLRMIGSSKLEYCPSCNGKPSKTMACPISQCDGTTGKYDAQSVYRVYDVLDRMGKSGKQGLAKHQKDPASEYYRCTKMVKRNNPGTRHERRFITYNEFKTTSIRAKSEASSTPIEKPSWFDDSFFQDEIDNHKALFKPTPNERKVRRGLLSTAMENINGAVREGIAKLPRLPKNDSRVAAIQQWLKNHDLPEGYRLPDVYRNTEVIDVTMRMGEKYPYFFVRTDSLFCFNKGGEHSHNNIYFLINERGMYQKCFCQCETTEGRKFGLCRDYKSSPYTLPNNVLKELYPEMYTNQFMAERARFDHNLENLSEDEYDHMLLIKELENIRKYDRITTDKASAHEKKFNSKRRISKRNF